MSTPTATAAQSMLIANVAASLISAVKHLPYGVAVTVLGLEIAPGEPCLYPDIMVLPVPLQYARGQRDRVTSPTLIVEVLTPSTEREDRVRKFAQYRRLASLQEFILVTEDALCIESYTRRPDGAWAFRTAIGAGATLHIVSLNATLAVDEIYKNIELPESAIVGQMVTPAEYLALDGASGIRHEYVDGFMIPMTDEPPLRPT